MMTESTLPEGALDSFRDEMLALLASAQTESDKKLEAKGEELEAKLVAMASNQSLPSGGLRAVSLYTGDMTGVELNTTNNAGDMAEVELNYENNAEANEDDQDGEKMEESTYTFLLLGRFPICDKLSDDENSSKNRMECHDGVVKTENGIVSTSTKSEESYSKSEDFWCLPFCFAVFVMAIQVAIYFFVFVKVISFDYPVNVDESLRVAEALAIIITVYTQNDFFAGVDLLTQGYKPFAHIPETSLLKFYAVGVTQIFVGLYGIWVTFYLIMQSNEIVDLILNFTAMEFVSGLDDAFYSLAQKGFVGGTIKEKAEAIEDIKYTPRKNRKWMRRIPHPLVMTALLGWFLYIRISQDNRRFGDNEIFVQFQDEITPYLPTLSGLYHGCTMSDDAHDALNSQNFELGTTVYTKLPQKECEKLVKKDNSCNGKVCEMEDSWKQEASAFFFCDDNEDNKFWAFAVGEKAKNPCENWSMKSYKPNDNFADEKYDLMTHSAEIWFGRDDAEIDREGDGFFEVLNILTDYDPEKQETEKCQILRSEGIAFRFPFYNRLENIVIASRPVFHNFDLVDSRDRVSSSGEYIIFNGRRWLVIKNENLGVGCIDGCGKGNSTSNACLKECLEGRFDPYSTKYNVSFISDPMDLETREDTWTPTSRLGWYLAIGDGRDAEPDTDLKSLAKSITDIENVLDAIESNTATDDQKEDANALFVESSTLKCHCPKESKICQDKLRCPDKDSLWIELKTDSHTGYSFTLADSATYYDSSDIVLLNKTGYFSWQEGQIMESKPFEESFNSYIFTTCVPKNRCIVMTLTDFAENGIKSPGGFNVFFNGQNVNGNENEAFSHIFYQFGECNDAIYPSLFDPSQINSNESFGCPAGGTSLTIDMKTDSFSEETSFLFTLDDNTEDVEDQISPGYFPFHPVNSIAFSHNTQYRYSTCIPDDKCVVLNLTDSNGDGFYQDSDGKFDVFFDGELIIPPELDSRLKPFTSCKYQFGSCESKVKCYDEEFNPVHECDVTSTSLSFELTTDQYNNDIAFEIGRQLNHSPVSSKIIKGSSFEWSDDGYLSPYFKRPFKTYRYKTCVPDDVCVSFNIESKSQIGLSEPGEFQLFFNSTEIGRPNKDEGIHFCHYQFGFCNKVVVCNEVIEPFDQSGTINDFFECHKGGASLSIDMETDSFSEETSFVITDYETWNSAPVDELKANATNIFTGYFSFDTVKSKDFDNNQAYRYASCIPDGECVVLNLTDSNGDGFYQDSNGKFDVSFNGSIILPPEHSSILKPFTSCVYQFGSCDSNVLCYDDEFNPDTHCEDGKILLALELTTDEFNGDISFEIGDKNNAFNNSEIIKSSVFEWNGNGHRSPYFMLPFKTYRYTTCVPNDVCVVVNIKNPSPNGLMTPGDFDLHYNSTKIDRPDEENNPIKYCKFQFGACEETVTCQEGPFERYRGENL